MFILTGATGFIGRHVLADILAEGHSVRALTRRQTEDSPAHPNLEWITGDAENPHIWEKLAIPDSIVVNLGYSNATPQSTAVAATASMIEICAGKKIGRFIHCSTASVYGANADLLITEHSACRPANEYGRLKLAIEQQFEKVHGRFPVAILRPSVVFGAGGEALIKLFEDLTRASGLINYCRSSLYGFRHTHLVPVETVVAAIKFLSTAQLTTEPEILNVSDEYARLNNFRSVEQIAMQELAVKPYPVRQVPVPRFILESLLRLRHRNAVNTRSKYCGNKLIEKGFINPISLETALHNAVASYKQFDKGDA